MEETLDDLRAAAPRPHRGMTARECAALGAVDVTGPHGDVLHVGYDEFAAFIAAAKAGAFDHLTTP